jgi:ribosomal protein L22
MTLYEKMLEIAKKEIKGMSYEDALEYLNNEAIPEEGAVCYLAYRSDAEQIAREYCEEILNLIREVYGENVSTELLIWHNMTWFAWKYYILGKGEKVLKDLGWHKNIKKEKIKDFKQEKGIYKVFLKIVQENIKDMNYDEALDYIDYYARPWCGSVKGLKTQEETEPLAAKYHDEIIELMKNEYDYTLPADCLTLNNMIWQAWEILILSHGEQVLKDLGVKNVKRNMGLFHIKI